MRILNSIIEAYSSVSYGIIVAVIIAAILFFSIAVFQGGSKRFSPLSYAIVVALAAFLTFQAKFLVGAIMLISDCSDIASVINDLVPSRDLLENSAEVRKSLQEVEKEFPFIKNLANIDEISKSLPDGAVGDAIMIKVYSYLNWYVVRRILWSLLACAIAGFGILYSMERIPRGRTRRTPGYKSISSRRNNTDDF